MGALLSELVGCLLNKPSRALQGPGSPSLIFENVISLQPTSLISQNSCLDKFTISRNEIRIHPEPASLRVLTRNDLLRLPALKYLLLQIFHTPEAAELTQVRNVRNFVGSLPGETNDTLELGSSLKINETNA